MITQYSLSIALCSGDYYPLRCINVWGWSRSARLPCHPFQ